VTLTNETAEQDAPPTEHVRLTVTCGSTQKSTYSFARHRINLGRCVEVRDHQHRLIRTNHIAFTDGDPVNHTVSRRHAHIDHAAKSGEYRVCDDGSRHGTSLIRNGRTIAVPTGARGVRLQSGDEIALGEAKLRVKF
jgi:pSer/pThr/pTyr-binding forkhead associated (FHA) protein